jgi:hypothetical protein
MRKIVSLLLLVVKGSGALAPNLQRWADLVIDLGRSFITPIHHHLRAPVKHVQRGLAILDELT